MRSGSVPVAAKVGLSGYCPVCVVEMKKWEKGNANFSSTFDGVKYLFPSQAIKAKFDAAPQKYVPALGGDCIVCYQKMGQRVPGSVQHPALHEGRLFLFPGAGEKAAFMANPDAFSNADLANKGECVVCRVKMNDSVPGSPEHTVVHQGLRYQFPSPAEAEMFRKSPGQFVSR